MHARSVELNAGVGELCVDLNSGKHHDINSLTPDHLSFSCAQCKCLDPNYKPKDPNCPGSCGSANYKGDGNCDDENNNCGCAYDGGDCCKETVGGPVKKDYCKACVCKDPKHKAKGCDGSCGEPKYVGDGNCDDVNNNCGCGYDGGDCCPKDGKKVVKDYCTVCKCLEKNE